MSADDSDAPSRRDLERVAFARADTPEQQSAASDALERLAAMDAQAAEERRLATAPEIEQDAPIPNATPSAVDWDSVDEQPELKPRRRPSVMALLVIIGLFVGAIAGIAIAHAQTNTVDPVAADATGSTPTPAPNADPAAALKSLLVPQTSADKKFPLKDYVTTLDIQPASVHRIMTASDGATLWTGRTGNDICLMWTSPHVSTDGSTAGVTCATPTGFENGGLMLSEGLVTWTWDGTSFTMTGRR